MKHQGINIIWDSRPDLTKIWPQLLARYRLIVSRNDVLIVEDTVNGKRYIPVSNTLNGERIVALKEYKKAGLWKWLTTSLKYGECYVGSDILLSEPCYQYELECERRRSGKVYLTWKG